jgi:hypothetical protein
MESTRPKPLLRDDYERRQKRRCSAQVLARTDMVWLRSILDDTTPTKVRLLMLQHMILAGSPQIEERR